MDLAVATICSVAVVSVFVGMMASYGKKRATRRYAEGKDQAPSVPYFAQLSKVLFFINMLLTLCGYWLDIFAFHQSNALRLTGAWVVVIGFICLRKAFAALSHNYSPMFDAYMPQSIQTEGIYGLIRHPIYSFNLLISLGLSISSGSAVVIVNSLIGWLFVMRAIHLEEAYLPQRFPDYQDYAKRTWKLIPYVY